MILTDWIPAYAGMTGGHEAHEARRADYVCCQRAKKDGRKSRLYLYGADGDRTHDLHVANVALSQLSYCPGHIVSSIRREAGNYSRPERANNNTI